MLKIFRITTFSRTLEYLSAVCFIIILILLYRRVHSGIDLTDESYYAIFIDDWLKGGVATSTLRTLHQTAALIVYPVVKLYVALSGTSSQLILLLRTLYLAGSIVASLAWVYLVSRLNSWLAAWMGGCLVLAFIPFGLPAPSYNTLGQQGLLLALSTLGLARLPNANAEAWILCSAASWSMATVAYPSLALPLAACLILLAFVDGWTRFLRLYLMLIICCEIIAWSMVVAVLSTEHLVESIKFLSAINDVDGWRRKLNFTLALIKGHPVFVAASVAAFLVGLLRKPIGVTGTALLLAGTIGCLFLGPPVLYCRSHDIITVLALSGAGLVGRFGRNNPIEDQVLAFVWIVSFVAGLTTMMTAFNSLYNFPVGAMPAGAASLVGLWRSRDRRQDRTGECASLLAHTVCIASVLGVSLTFLYGDLPNHPWPAERVDWGAYAGLAGQPEQVAALKWMRDVVSPLTSEDHRIAFFGWPYGLILATSARPLTLAVFPLDQTMNPRGLAIAKTFFEDPNHRASLVVIDRGPYTQPFNPMGAAFDRWYDLIGTVQQTMSSFSLYRRR